VARAWQIQHVHGSVAVVVVEDILCLFANVAILLCFWRLRNFGSCFYERYV